MKKFLSMLLAVCIMFTCYISVSAYSFSQNGTATKKATAYRLPSVNSSDIWWVDKNDKLEVFCQDGDYYLVLYPFNNTGKHIISYVPTSAVNASNIPSASAFYKNERMIVTTNANLYHNPSTDTIIGASGSNQTVRTTVSKNQEVTVLFEKDGFYCIRTSNDIGFIEKSKLTVETKCEHTNTKNEVKSWEVSPKNDTYHTVIETYDIYCNNCGELLKSNSTKTYDEKHDISNNKCKECSYTVPGTEASECKHTNTVKHTSEDVENGVQIVDDKKHTVFKYYNLYCTDCYTYVETNLPETYDEEHNFINNVCSVCNLENLVDKPAASTISINKNTFTPNEEISFSWTTAERATGYDLHIYKEGQESRYKLLSYNDIRSTSVKIADEGLYTAAIYSTNTAGYTGGANWVKFTVKKAVTEKTAYVYNTDGANLNMRSAANTSSSIVTKIPAGATLTVTGNKTNNFYPVKYNGKSGYSSASYITFNKPNTSNHFAYPVSNPRVTCGFYGYTNHGGIDFGVSMGTSVKASKGGTIAIAKIACNHNYGKSYNCGCSGGYGNYIKINHNDGTETLYAHLTSISVKVGQTVSQGQEIGKSGSTGWSTGPHLHFEIRVNGVKKNPADYLK